MVAKILIFAALLGTVVAHSAFSSQRVHKYDGPHGSAYQHRQEHRSGHGQGSEHGYGNGHRQSYRHEDEQSHGRRHGNRYGNDQRQGYEHRLGQEQGRMNGWQRNNEMALPKYDFEYTVEDSHTGDHKAQHESRDGDVVHGSYSLLQPDGSIRNVHYHDDGHSGFHADVSYSTRHDAPQHNNY